MSTIFGRLELPAAIELHDITGINSAWNDLGPRDIVGIVRHSMLGSLRGTLQFFQNEARRTALTDCGIGGPWDGSLDGMIHQYIPKGSRASPHASGPASDLEGDGIAFVRVIGVNGVNRNLFSVERSDNGRELAPFSLAETPKQWHAMNNIIAYKFDQAEVPWDLFPKHPKYGITTFLDHWEFGPKQCPFAAVRAQTDNQINAIRGLLKAAQTGIGSQTPGKVTPIPAEPGKVVAEVPYSTEDDLDFLRRRFGSAVKILADGTTQLNPLGQPVRYTLDPKGVVSNAWINRSLEDQQFASLERVIEDQQGNRLVTYFEFGDGSTLVNAQDTRGWFWAGEEAA